MSDEELFDHIDVWVDGSIRGNPHGDGGLGIFIESKRLDYVKAIGVYFPEKEGNTNNRMEVSAVIASVKALKNIPLVVNLYLDSMYVVGGLAAGGYKSNEDLWAELFKEIGARTIYINPIHVKGHSGVDRNTVVDRLANLARERKENIEFIGNSEEILNKFS